MICGHCSPYIVLAYPPKNMKNSKNILLSILFALALVMGSVGKVSACHPLNPFCNSPIPGIPKPPTNTIPAEPPKIHSISPSDGGETWIEGASPSFYISSSFNLDERVFMEWAMARINISSRDRSKFVACTSKYTNENTLDNNMLKQISYDSIFSQLLSRKRTYIEKLRDPKALARKSIATAPVGLNTYYFFMSINPAFLRPISPDLQTTSQVNKIIPNAELIGSTMLHEMLHNLGYVHERYSETDDDADRIGNFVYEAGWCSARSYKNKPPGSLSLTDSSNYHVD